jgi:hypothetical protein
MSKNEAKFDFDSLDTGVACEEPFEFELTHPVNNKPLGVFVSVVGMESEGSKNWLRQNVNRERRKLFEAQRKGQPAEPKSLEEDEADTVAMCARLMRGWRTVIEGKSDPVVIWKGERLDFTPDNASRWLSHFGWVRPQIIEAASDVGNFLGN